LALVIVDWTIALAKFQLDNCYNIEEKILKWPRKIRLDPSKRLESFSEAKHGLEK
jgi:hypothetical protein